MGKNAKVYTIVLSCPTDIVTEKEIIEQSIDYFNRTTGDKLGIFLLLKHWSTDSYSQAGAPAQQILNKQFIEDADMIIGIFANRMGTPTKKYESGTAEEIQEAIKKNKQVFLYFSDVQVSPSELDLKQKKLVDDFRKKVQDEELAYYKQYASLEEFEKVIISDLTLYFLDKDREPEKGQYSTMENKSNLIVKSVEDGKPSEFIKSHSIDEQMRNFIEHLNKEISEGIIQINEMYIEPVENTEKSLSSTQQYFNDNSVFGSSLYKLPNNVVEEINDFVSEMKMNLNDDFFELGNLKKVNQPNIIQGGTTFSIQGSEEEKEKYDLLRTVYNSILRFKEWKLYAEEFSSISLVPLCLSNEGTIYETEITVKIKIDKKSFVNINELQPPGLNIINEVNESDFIGNIFGSVKSSEITEYYNGISIPMPSFNNDFLPTYFRTEPSYDSYLEIYKDHFDDINDYELFEENDSYILEYYFKELKQHTAVSFPSKILLNNEESIISYQIISRENPNVVEGEISFR
ncbi:hypothetical protein [Globicatella sanguinis]